MPRSGGGVLITFSNPIKVAAVVNKTYFAEDFPPLPGEVPRSGGGVLIPKQSQITCLQNFPTFPLKKPQFYIIQLKYLVNLVSCISNS